MAFVARRSSDGKVVDRQQVSGGGVSRPLALSDVSDEESPDSLQGYTSRTYRASTVRFLGQGDGDGDVDSELEEENLDMDALDIGAEDLDDDSDSDSITNFCNQLDEEEANEAMHMLKFEEHVSVLEHSEECDDLCDLDEDDIMDEQTMMGKPEEAAATDTETVMNTDQDLRSLCSFESFTPTLTLRNEANSDLDNISVKTCFNEDDQDTMSDKNFPMKDKQDDLSPTNVLKEDNLDNLSTRTYDKHSSLIPKRRRQREPDLDQLSSRTYDLSNCGSSLRLSNGGPGQHDNSSISTCSWTDMYHGAVQPSDGHSAIVPSLSLASSSSETSTYYKSLTENKERHSQAAFDDWKARKASQKQKSLQAAKQEREKREAEAALRQQQAQARFQEWCRRKEEQQRQEFKKSPFLRQSGGSGNSSGSISSSGSGSGSGSGPVSGPGAARKAASEATKQRLKEWKLVKTEQQEREREQKRRLEENKRKLEEERKQRSQGAWNNWMKQVDKRAKPVPLNQGFDTLRGTISNIYINPVQWVSNIEPKESGRSR